MTESESTLQASMKSDKARRHKKDSSGEKKKLSSSDKKKKHKSSKSSKHNKSTKHATNVDSDSDDDAMKALMDSFIAENFMDDDASTSSSSTDSGSEDEIRQVILDKNVFDHVVFAASDLQEAIAEFHERTGVEPIIAGNIRGLGVTSARVSFSGSSFLEIIAPDPEKPGPIGMLLQSIGLTGLVPFHWAVRTVDVDSLEPVVKKMGYVPDVIAMTGANRDLTIKHRETLYLYGHKMRGMCPFFVDWGTSDHPCETAPIVGDLIGVSIKAPKGDAMHKLMEHTGATGFTLEEGSPQFEITFDSPEGEITMGADKMIGFQFPGFEEEVGPIIGDGEEEMPEFVLPKIPDMLNV